MRIALVAALSIGFAVPGLAQNAPPSTDIYLAPITLSAGHVTVGTPFNITQRKGYDNQPSFTPDGASILYTSMREDGQADIWRYDLREKSTHQVTHTPESEYSPTVMPGGHRLSVIRVEKDSTQRLWSFALDGSDPQLVLSDVKPVGYHAWIDDTTLALFVLGKPNTLQVANIRTGKAVVVDHDIGRSLQRIPGTAAVSYLKHRANGGWFLERFSGGRPVEAAPMLPGSDYVAWLPSGQALAGAGGKLFTCDSGRATWIETADLTAAGVAHVSRLAVSPDGRWLALVADDTPSR